VIARPLFFATVDPDVARVRGVPVPLVSTVFLVLLGSAAAEVSQITGALLVFALLVMPAAAAQQLTARPAVSFVVTIGLGLVIVWLGLGAAYFSIYPVGFFITTFGFAAYVLATAGRLAATRARSRQLADPVIA
jgi:zinc/manganese transport system permease protein